MEEFLNGNKKKMDTNDKNIIYTFIAYSIN